MGWNTVYTSTDDLLALSVINMFVDAINERFHDNGGLAVGLIIPSGLAHFVDGDDAGDSGWFSHMQDVTERCIGFYGNPHVTYDGSTYATDADYQINTTYAWGTWANYCAIRRGGNSWTRKYPREFDNAAAAAYRDGSAFANGDLAYRRDNDKVYLRSAGAWVEQPFGTDADTVTAYGQAREGDYLGPWIFNELRDALNDCIWFLVTSGIDHTNVLWEQNGGGSGSSTTSMAAAYASAVAGAPDPGPPAQPRNLDVLGDVANAGRGSYNSTSGTWTASVGNEEGHYSVGLSGFQINPPPQCDVDLLICGNYFISPSASVLATYECPFGYTPLHTRTKVETIARAGAPSGVLTAGAYGNVGTCPTNPPPDPSGTPGATSANGWRGKAVAVIRCDVAGGYVYHA